MKKARKTGYRCGLVEGYLAVLECFLLVGHSNQGRLAKQAFQLNRPP